MDYRRMIQESLDGALDAETAEELWELLSRDEKLAEEHSQLARVHQALSNPSHVRAPQRLAATIMARLAQTIEAQADMEELAAETKLALMMSISVVQMAMMPVMVAATYLVVNYTRNPAILSRVIQRVIALQIMMIDALVILLDEIERMIEKDPESAPVAMSLIPIALMGIIDYIRDETRDMNVTLH
jgi:hypothetical protein